MKLHKKEPQDWQLLNYPTPLFRKQLSNIPQALQCSQQIVKPKLRPSIPMSNKNKEKVANKSQITLNNRIKKILRTPKPSHRSHNNTPTHRKYILDGKQKQLQNLRTRSRITGDANKRNTISPHRAKDKVNELPVLPVGASAVLKNRMRRNKSVLDKILDDRDHYAKAYFEELGKIQKINEKNKSKNEQITLNEEQANIDFQFPEIVTGQWKVKGFIKGQYILLRGIHKNGQVIIKKYEYEKVYAKLRKDYQSWVQLKFSFQS